MLSALPGLHLEARICFWPHRMLIDTLLLRTAGQVIRGWDEGVAQMSKGQRADLTCTPDFAYGSRGAAGVSHTSHILEVICTCSC